MSSLFTTPCFPMIPCRDLLSKWRRINYQIFNLIFFAIKKGCIFLFFFVLFFSSNIFRVSLGCLIVSCRGCRTHFVTLLCTHILSCDQKGMFFLLFVLFLFFTVYLFFYYYCYLFLFSYLFF